MRIQHNITAMNAYRNYNTNTKALAKNLEKLSSGYRINRAGDDAAGLAISEKMRAQITGLEVAQKNAKDGISLVQTAEGAMTEVHDMLNRMYELAEQSSNGTYQNDVDREQMQKEIQSLSDEINRIADSTNFNGINLLDGSLGLSDAIKITSAGATAAQAGTAISLGPGGGDHFPTAVAAPGDETYHEGTGNVAQVNPEFKISFEGASYNSVAGSGVNVTVGGQTFKAATTGTAAAPETIDAKKLATAFVTAFNTATVDDETDKAGMIGNFAFKATDNGDGTVSFTLLGAKKDGAGTNAQKLTNKEDFSQADVTALNALLGCEVKLAAADGNVTQNADHVQKRHDVMDLTSAVAGQSGKKAGIDFTLTADLVKNGYTLKIDDQTYTFKTDANDTSLTGSNVIDVSDSSLDTDAKRIQEAVNQLSHKTTGNFKVEAAGADKIHIDQLDTSNVAYDSEQKLHDVFSAAAAGTPAKGAGSTIELNANGKTVQEGDQLTIGGKKYIFTADTSKTSTDANTIYVDKNNAASDLASKIKANDTSLAVETSGNKVTVRDADPTKKAPTVLGKGLVLQIGDTSDDFNKMTVSVKDMHTAAMGLGNLSVSSQDEASDAMTKIKDAINYVSDVRGDLGSLQNRLDHTISNLSVMQENIQDAEATIRDVDVAEEMMSYTKNNILVQSAQAMLAQANQLPQGVLQLLQ